MLKNAKETLEKLGQKSIDPKVNIENGQIVARGKGLTDGSVALENGNIATRLGIVPTILATLDDVTARYVFEDGNIVVEALGKSVAKYTGNVKLSKSAATPKTTKGFFGTTFKVITDGGLKLTEDEVIAVDSESKDVYAVRTTDGFDLSSFISGDETGFEITREGIEAWLKVAGEGELFSITFNESQSQPAQQPEPQPNDEKDDLSLDDLKQIHEKNNEEFGRATGLFKNNYNSLNQGDEDDDDGGNQDDDDGGKNTELSSLFDAMKNGNVTIGGDMIVYDSFEAAAGGKNNYNSLNQDDDDGGNQDDDDWINDDDDEIVPEGDTIETVETAVKKKVEETFTLTAEDEQLINSWIVDNGDNTTRVRLNGDLKQPAGARGLQLTEWQKSTITLIRWFEKHGFKTYLQFKNTFCDTKLPQLEAAGVKLFFTQVKGDYERQLPYFSMNGGQKRVYFDLDANRNFVFIQ